MKVEVAFLKFVFHDSENDRKRAARKFFFDYFFGQLSCQVIFFVQLARDFFFTFCLTKFDRARPGYPPLSSLFFIFFRFFFLAFLRFRAMLPAVFRDARKTVSSVFFIPSRFFFFFFRVGVVVFLHEIKSAFGWRGCQD